MALINFLFGNRSPSGFALSGVVEFEADLTIEEAHERSSDVTEHPVETGETISDHIILNPERLRLEGFVTDAGVAVFGSQSGRTQTSFEALDAAWREREPVQVVTGYRTYQDMAITRLDMPRSRPGSMRFSMEFVHIRVVVSETARLAQGEPGGAGNTDSAGTNDLTQAESDQGRQSTREGADSTDRRSSTLFDVFGLGS